MRNLSTLIFSHLKGVTNLAWEQISELSNIRRVATHGVASHTGASGGASLTRFYRKVDVKLSEEPGKTGYIVLLDGRVLKTPAKQNLIVPTKSLALGIAAEWEWQQGRIDTNTMPLMSLAAMALDKPRPRTIVIETLLQYIPTDPVFCRAEPGDLAEKQAELLDPLLSWVEKEVGISVHPTSSIFGVEFSHSDMDKLRDYIHGLDDWELAVAEQLASSCKSVCASLMAVNGQLKLEEVLKIARIEEDDQIEKWGLVEDFALFRPAQAPERDGEGVSLFFQPSRTADTEFRHQDKTFHQTFVIFDHISVLMKPGKVICQYSGGKVTLPETGLATTPKDFLLSTPRGAYTTAQVWDGFLVVDWDVHVERLARSIQALYDATGCSLFKKFVAHVLRSAEECSTVLSSAIAPAVLSVLETANHLVRHNPLNTMYLIVSVCPNDDSPSFLDVQAVVGNTEDSDQRLSSPSQPSCTAAILGPPRDIPIAKDTAWVSDREYLEAMRPAGACECLLSTKNGNVLEGMITNFYVIRKMQRPHSEECDLLLQTASIDEGVVWGTLRLRVLEACQRLGIKVEERAPSIHERHTWNEAFLTNSLRGVQPLSRVVCDAKNVWGLPAWELELPEASITQKLRQCVGLLIKSSSVDIRQVVTSRKGVN